MALVERDREHVHRMEEKAMNAEIIEVRIGQIFALLIGLTTIIAGAVTAIMDAQWPGALIGSLGVVGLVAVFIKGRVKNKEE